MKEANYKLVNSTYSAEDAREVLLKIIKDKVTFIERSCFSMEERNQEGVDHLRKRLVELKASHDDILKLTQEAMDNNLSIKIDAEIKVEVLANEPIAAS